MKRLVFEDGLLFPAFTAPVTLQLWQLGHLSLLVPPEVCLPRPSSVPAFLPLCGPRPLDLIIGASRHSMTFGGATLPMPADRARLLDECQHQPNKQHPIIEDGEI